MQLLYFSKMFKDSDVADLIRRGHEIGVDGYDLAVRPGYVVGPDNVESLPQAVKALRAEALDVPMVTAPGDFLRASDPRAERYLRAMAQADVHLLKLGYFGFDAQKDYWAEVDGIRRELSAWERLGEQYGVTICYHTHSGNCLGLNGSALAHLIHGFDPRFIGGYLDPGHLLVCGEPFDFAAAVVADQLRIVALKDRLFTQKWVPAGQGDVNWAPVFATLVARGFDGPLSIHAEYHMESPEAYYRSLIDEVAYFKRLRDEAIAGRAESA